jgi:hypothetical protein
MGARRVAEIERRSPRRAAEKPRTPRAGSTSSRARSARPGAIWRNWVSCRSATATGPLWRGPQRWPPIARVPLERTQRVVDGDGQREAAEVERARIEDWVRELALPLIREARAIPDPTLRTATWV